MVGSYHSSLVHLMSELGLGLFSFSPPPPGKNVVQLLSRWMLLPPAVEFFRIHVDCNGIFIHKICRYSFNTVNRRYLESLLGISTLLSLEILFLGEEEWGCSFLQLSYFQSPDLKFYVKNKISDCIATL